MLTYLSFLLLLSLRVLPAQCVSTVQFYSDKNCQKSIGKINGTDNGACFASIATDASAQLISLDPHCAATIYSDPFCTNSATIANLNTCMSGSLIVGSFSIDCQAAAPSTAAFTAAGGQPTSTSVPIAEVTSGQKLSPPQPTVNLSPSALAGIVVSAIVAIGLIPIGYTIWHCHSKRHEQRLTLLPVRKMSDRYDTESLKASISAPQQEGGLSDPVGRGSATIIPFFMTASTPPSRVPSRIPSRALLRTASNVSPRARADSDSLVSPLAPDPALVARQKGNAAPPSPVEEREVVPSAEPAPSDGGAWWQRARDIRSMQERRQGNLSLFPPKSPYERMI